MSAGAKTRVLVFPCGSENGSEIHEALRYSLHVELFGASSVDDHGRYLFANYEGDLPRIGSADFEDRFGELVGRLAIDMIFATHDTVHEYLAPLAARLGFFLVNGDPATARIARRKSATYAHFSGAPWIPSVHSSAQDVPAWPVVVKPDLGQGGQGVTTVETPEALDAALAAVAEPLIVEYLPGEEVTVDCFTDRHGRLLWAGARSRERIRAGIAMRSRFLDPDPEVDAVARAINQGLALRGPWFFQLKRSHAGTWKLLEISCRVAGTMVAQRARGVNLPLMAVQDYLGRDLIAMPQPAVRQIDRRIASFAAMEAAFDTVFVDLDDTLIIDGRVVPVVVHFLYQVRNEGKRVVLITRHDRACEPTLEAACLPVRLFDEIIHITDRTPKSAYMTDRSIFIDNHFPERKEVAEALGIPVLDVDMLEFFLR